MIITITNNRGGVGKSTTAQTLAIGLSIKKYKVLLIDLDTQCNTTATFKVNREPNTIFKVLNQECNIQDAIYHTQYIDIIPSDTNLSVLNNIQLKPYLNKIKSNYDYIIIDTPPSLSNITLDAVYNSDYLLIPMLAELYSIQGLDNIQRLIDRIHTNTDNKSVKIIGLLITHYKGQTILNQSLRDALYKYADKLNTKVYDATIRDSIIFSDSQFTSDIALLKYPNHNASQDYINFINEFIKDTKKEVNNGNK